MTAAIFVRLGLFVAAVFGLFYLAAFFNIDLFTNINRIKALLESLAIVAALWFFAYKVAAGWMIPNLRLSIQTERRHRSDTADDLVVKVVLDKGQTDGLALYAVKLNLEPVGAGETPEQEIDLSEIKRLCTTEGGVKWKSTDERPLYLAAGDLMEFSAVTAVKRSAAYKVQAVVVGRRAWIEVTRHPSQWRSCCISLPQLEMQPGAAVSTAAA